MDDDECDHLAVEEVRSEMDGYYCVELVCVGCGEVVSFTGWLSLFDPEGDD